MAGRRSNPRENNTDGYDYQHYTLLYCIDHLMRHKDRFPGFEIGSSIEGHGALDDIVLHATLSDERVVTNLLQVKHSNQTIHKTYLCYNDKTYVLKYFDTFLDVQMGREGKPIPLEQLDQLIIWTNMPFATEVKDWFEEYVPTERKRDVLGDSKNLSYQRFRFREDKYKGISFRFHTRMKLVYEIVEGLFNKQKWNPKSAAKSYYLTMAKQIIEGSGVDMKIKQEFISGQGLNEETIRFRKCFKEAMERKFMRIKSKNGFLMEKLNSDEFRGLFELNVDTNVQVRWEEWKNEEEDLEEFRKRFVFYVEVPQVDMLKTYLMKQFSRFTQVSELLKECAFTKMINKKQYENLISLIKLRQCMDLGPYTELLFDDPNDPLPTIVKNFLTKVNSGTCLHVKAIQDVYCTVSRLISPVKNCLAPLNDRYLVLSCTNFYKSLSNLQTILEETSLLENGLKCIIIADVPRDKLQEIETTLLAGEVKAILVGCQLDNGFVDEFDISTLHPDCKDIINNREIFLSEQQEAKVSEIFGNEFFQKENYRLALDLFQSHRPIQLAGNELQLDEYFRERKLKQKKTNVLDLMVRDDYQQIVVSDQAGMGKSTELINIAVEMRKTYKDHLVVCLDCKNAIRHHEKEDMAYIVCQMTSNRRGTKELVVRKIIELGKMILLLDGIDEVSDSCKTNLKVMLCTISKTKLFKLVIATRPHCSPLIQQIFPSCITCQLEPFSKSDQLEYLMSFWKVNELADENYRARIKENVNQLINKFQSMLKHDCLIGIPLQTYMIAVIYKTSITSKDFEQPKPYKIGFIYKQFVELKFQESIKRQFDLTTKAHENAIRTQWENFVPDHITMAQKIYANAPESELIKLCDQLQIYGLLRLHPSVGFVHHTYFEYFISLYFLIVETDPKKEFVSFMFQNLYAARESIIMKFIDFHMEEIDPSKKIETENRLTDCFPNDFKLPPISHYRHPDKLRERYALICKLSNLPVLLNNSLPMDTKSTLETLVGNELTNIELKQLDENLVVELLNVLLKEEPENVVRRYLTDFKDDDEDFLEIACQKSFVRVLDWLINNLIPNLNCEEQIAFNSYVDRRFDKYLQLVVKHNNAQFLQSAIQRAKDLWPKIAMKCFLLKCKVLLRFLNTVELISDTEPLNDEQRIEMIHHMHDLYQWAFEGQFFASEDCRNKIADLQIHAIKCAFHDAFPSK